MSQRIQIRNKGYLHREKRETNTRILSININEMRIKDKRKIQQMIDFSIKNKIDIIMITETNSKWIIVMENIIKNKMKRLG